MDERLDLEAAFGAHSARVFAFFRRMGMDREGARDLSQETFLRVFRTADRFRGESSPTAWILGIARNVFREWLRKEDRPQTKSLADRGVESEQSEETIEVQEALRRLDPQLREILVLRFVLDLRGAEVARILDISHAAVRQRVARAKKAFIRLWEG